MDRDELNARALTLDVFLVEYARTWSNADIRIGWALDRSRGEEPRADTPEYEAFVEFERWLLNKKAHEARGSAG